MYKRVMGALGIMLLLVAAVSFYEYEQDKQAVDLADISASQGGNQQDEGKAAVYVTGEVAKPGVVYVAQDGRVGEAINECGGLLPTADSSQVNMAATVKDGMEIRVRAKSLPSGNHVGEAANKASGEATTANSKKSAAAAATQGGSAGDMVNINTADVEGLRKLKGIGPAMAQRIIDYREANGAFQAPEDLQQVKGIGKAKFAKLKDQIAI